MRSPVSASKAPPFSSASANTSRLSSQVAAARSSIGIRSQKAQSSASSVAAGTLRRTTSSQPALAALRDAASIEGS